jgi:hypothetical protein
MKTKRALSGRLIAICLMTCLLPASWALSPPPPMPVDVLAEFYHATGGDDWTHNDGWLDPDVNVCDWYGITCRNEASEFGGFSWVGFIGLPDNNLTGELSAELIEQMTFHPTVPVPSRGLDLSGNRLQGSLDQLPWGARRVILARNDLSGPLPEIDQEAIDQEAIALVHLDLSGNHFEGPVPESWAGLALELLDLSDNLLEGSIEPALAALADENAILRLTDNPFSGTFEPVWLDGMMLDHINLCWTEVTVDDPDLEEWLEARHEGGSRHLCMDRERLPLDPTISGSWFSPERVGEGFSLMLLENGVPLLYWFSHISNNRQLWLLGTGSHNGPTVQLVPMLRTRGSFEHGFGEISHPIFRGGRMRLDRVGEELLHGEFRIAYSGYDLAQPGHVIPGTPPPMPDTSRRWDHVQLTQLAGTTCDNQVDQQWISGAWYVPDRVGQGFVVEVLENGRGVVYWFTYRPDGTQGGTNFAPAGDWQAWMTLDADFDGDSLLLDPLLRPRDTEFATPGNTTGVVNLPWGTLRLEFQDDLNGHAWFESDDEAFGSGDFAIERLARPMLAECD